LKRILLLLIFNFSILFAYLIHLNNKCFQEYYETNWRIPVLAYYYLTEKDVNSPNPIRIHYFKIDKRLPKKYISKSSDYKNTGYDRGHLVGNDIVNYDIRCQKYSFLMSNITPQIPTFNRSIYKKIEKFEMKLAKNYKKIFVITGAWGGNTYIKNKILIPRYYFKIFITKKFIYYIIINNKGKKLPLNTLYTYPYFRELINVIFQKTCL
jgi:DNA/RNA endonuclease G (NUC1)